MPKLLALKFTDLDMPRLYAAGKLEDVRPESFVVAPRDGEETVAFVSGIEYRAKAHLDLRPQPYPTALRPASEAEIEQWWEHRALERKAVVLAKEAARALNLPLKISSVRYSAAQQRLLYFFTSDTRVDFRGLVRELSLQLKLRIELWQIGVRDEAKMLDGFGVCGQRTCCSTFLTEFKPINIRLAREQDIGLPPAKLTGQCGRFLCCLAYEVDQYREMSRHAHPKGATLVLADGKRAIIIDRNLIAGTYTLRMEDGSISIQPAASLRIERADVPEQMKRTGGRIGSASSDSESSASDAEVDQTPAPSADAQPKPAPAPPAAEDRGGRGSHRRRPARQSAPPPPPPPPAPEPQEEEDESEEAGAAGESDAPGRQRRRRRKRRRRGGGGSGGGSAGPGS